MKKNKTKTSLVAEGICEVNTSLRLLRLPDGPLALLVFGEDKAKREKAIASACRMLKKGGGDTNSTLKVFTKLKDNLLMLRLDALPTVDVHVKGGCVEVVGSSDAMDVKITDNDCGETDTICL